MASNLPGNSRTMGPATCPIDCCTFAAEFSIVLQHIRRSHSPLDVPSNFVVSNGLSQCPTCKNYFKKIQSHVARCSKQLRNAPALEAGGLNAVSGTVPSDGAPSQSQCTVRGSNHHSNSTLPPSTCASIEVPAQSSAQLSNGTSLPCRPQVVLRLGFHLSRLHHRR